MANEFVARKGLISSGSINVSGSVTASFFKGDGSQLTNIAAIAAVSGTLNIDTYTFVGNGTTTNYVLSQSYNANSLFLSVDGLTQTNIEDYTVTTNTVSFVTAPPSQSNILVRALVNVTQNATGSFSGSFFGIVTSASYAQTASYALNAQSGGSGAGFPFSGSAVITGSLQVVPTGSVGGITGSVSGALTGTFPYSGLTETPTLVSASSQIDYNSITNKLSGVVSSSTQVQPLLPDGTVSSSGQVDYNLITNKLSGVVSASAQILPLLPTGTISSSGQVIVQNTTGIGALATTGSNTFVADQTITGSLFISQNLVVQGSSSISYISQSTLNIGTNIITVNTNTPGTRLGGISVIDSASLPQRSGSLFFDSINDQWIFVHQNTAGGTTSSVVLMGPPTFDNIGNETLLTQNRILKADGLEHIIDSQISDNGVTVSITNGLSVGTNITASSITATGGFTGSIASASFATTASYALNSAGGGALSSSVVVESYTFVGNDVTTNYQISKSYSDSSVTVTVGGLTYINPNDYSISGSTIVFVEPPLSASNISVKALMNVAQNATGSFSGSFTGDGSKLVNISAPLQVDTYTFDADGSTTIFNLGKTYSSDAVIVSVDGLTYTNPTDYSVAGTTVTFVDIPNSGSTISVKGFINTGNATGSYSGSFVGDGSGLTTLPISVTKDEYQYTANGVTTNYTLSRLYDISSLNVSVAGLRYAPITDYTLNLFTLSFLTAPPSGANIYIDAFVNTPTTATGSFSGSFNGNFNIVTSSVTFAQSATSASYAANADLLDGLNSTVFATTGSNVFVGNQRITGSVILSSSLPTELQIIGDTEITGSLRLLSGGITASLLGTSSFATTTNNLNGGTTNYIPLWSSTTVQSSSAIYQLAGNIGINNIVPSASLHVSGTTMVDQII